MTLPENIKYTKEHTWLKIEGNIGIIGITDFAQSELGEIVYPDLPNIGSSFKQDEVFGTVEALKTISDLFMPTNGRVIEQNKTLFKEPTLINTDPYGAGWLIKVELLSTSETNNLLTAEDYGRLIGK